MRALAQTAAPLAALLLAACSASPTWTRVNSVRVDTRDSADPSAAYAQNVSSSLKAAGVEHKVVTYQFRYITQLREEAIATRTAVVYRDGTDARHPWWLAEDSLRVPKWVPGDDLNRQLSFHVRRPAEVLSVDGASQGDNKGIIESEDGEIAIAHHEPAPPRENASPNWFQRLFARRPAVENRQPRIDTRPARLSPAPATRALATSPDARALAIFRARHGTAFDPASVADRVKMEAIAGTRRAIAGR